MSDVADRADMEISDRIRAANSMREMHWSRAAEERIEQTAVFGRCARCGFPFRAHTETGYRFEHVGPYCSHTCARQVANEGKRSAR